MKKVSSFGFPTVSRHTKLSLKYTHEEIFRRARLAMTGVHVVVVLSVRARLSKGERIEFQCQKSFLGPKLIDYIINIFASTDELEYEERTLDDCIGRDCPESIKGFHVVGFVENGTT